MSENSPNFYTVGARPWQILPHLPMPEPVPFEKTPIKYELSEEFQPRPENPPEYYAPFVWVGFKRGRKNQVSNYVMRIGAAVAVDMISNIFDSSDPKNILYVNYLNRLVSLLLDYPSRHAKRREKNILSEEILTTFSPGGTLSLGLLRDDSNGSALYALFWLARGDWEKAILQSLVSLVAPPQYSAWAVYYYDDDPEVLKQIIERLRYWTGIWWAETLEVLAFQQGGIR